MTPPPSLASINPRSALSMALFSISSSRPAFLAKRVKDLLLNIRTLPPRRLDIPNRSIILGIIDLKAKDFEFATLRPYRAPQSEKTSFISAHHSPGCAPGTGSCIEAISCCHSAIVRIARLVARFAPFVRMMRVLCSVGLIVGCSCASGRFCR